MLPVHPRERPAGHRFLATAAARGGRLHLAEKPFRAVGGDGADAGAQERYAAVVAGGAAITAERGHGKREQREHDKCLLNVHGSSYDGGWGRPVSGHSTRTS